MEYTFDKFIADVDNIVDCITRDEWKPELIVGVQRGGLIPAVMLSHKLGIKMKTLSWSTRDSVDKEIPFGVKLAHDYSKKNILVVDDIIDSGLTIREIKQQMPNARFASLIWNIKEHQGAPHYFGRTLDRNIDQEWVNFWWEK
jgi:hypoxanthine phosphoribosyltransferase